MKNGLNYCSHVLLNSKYKFIINLSIIFVISITMNNLSQCLPSGNDDLPIISESKDSGILPRTPETKKMDVDTTRDYLIGIIRQYAIDREPSFYPDFTSGFSKSLIESPEKMNAFLVRHPHMDPRIVQKIVNHLALCRDSSTTYADVIVNRQLAEEFPDVKNIQHWRDL